MKDRRVNGAGLSGFIVKAPSVVVDTGKPAETSRCFGLADAHEVIQYANSALKIHSKNTCAEER